ncbi:MAG: phosphatidylserine decarboxylase [Campylobacteraceae bacterium]|jgi:phosphatidylserine decarboxylase|nr:phosphatidylserine decarboxylase [Campylobacteraceae bacterium]
MMFYITNVFSRIFGFFAAKRFPKKIQRFINENYVKAFNIDMSEFEAPQKYKNLNELFTRSFKTPRNITRNNKILISMCDALVSEEGIIKHNDLSALQIKGSPYSVNLLLGDYILAKEKKKLEGGIFVNLYLSPADYHHYHAPCYMKIIKAIHIPGKLYPVNLKWINKKAGIFTENERVVLECETKDGAKFFLIFVGALNVGKMRFCFDNNICTNIKDSTQILYTYKDLHVSQGDELGFFEMGSTVVFLGENGIFKSLTKCGEKVRFGDKIIQITKN